MEINSIVQIFLEIFEGEFALFVAHFLSLWGFSEVSRDFGEFCRGEAGASDYLFQELGLLRIAIDRCFEHHKSSNNSVVN